MNKSQQKLMEIAWKSMSDYVQENGLPARQTIREFTNYIYSLV